MCKCRFDQCVHSRKIISQVIPCADTHIYNTVRTSVLKVVNCKQHSFHNSAKTLY
jgi:hypothetical protein